ncbi:MAG: hypothetical protein ACK5NE_07630 [Brachymonas sp.]
MGATPMKKAMSIIMIMTTMRMRQPIWIRRWPLLPLGNGCAFPIWTA